MPGRTSNQLIHLRTWNAEGEHTVAVAACQRDAEVPSRATSTPDTTRVTCRQCALAAQDPEAMGELARHELRQAAVARERRRQREALEAARAQKRREGRLREHLGARGGRVSEVDVP